MACRKWNRQFLGFVTGGVIVLAVLLVVVVIERVSDSPQAEERGDLVRPRGNTSLGQARAFRDYPLYFAGETAAGYRLEAVIRTDRTSPAPHTEFSFIYGRCGAVGDQGCAPPLTILVWPACYRYETRYAIPPNERTVIRDVPARTSREFRRLELYPAGTTIIINGDGLKSKAQLLEVARRLRAVNVPLRPAASLPAPPPHAGHTIRCHADS
jgi:hypothetical protein